MGEVRVIDKKDFYEMFIDALRNGKKFKLEDKIVDGSIDILEIYERIENDGELRKLIDKDSNLNLDIKIDFRDVIKLTKNVVITNFVVID